MEGLIKIEDLLRYMQDHDLMIAPRHLVKLEQRKERALRQKSLSYRQIAEAGLWGQIGKKAVEARVKKYLINGELEEGEVFFRGNATRIYISSVIRIAKNQGTL